MIEPIRLSFEVRASPAHAFEVWTGRISQWWPADHTVSGSPGLTVVLEPRAGGRIFERESGGTEHEWGEVTVWDPPSRLVYLWHLRRDRADATEVEIRFAPQLQVFFLAMPIKSGLAVLLLIFYGPILFGDLMTYDGGPSAVWDAVREVLRK